MVVKGSASVTLSQYRDTDSVTRYYKLQSSSLAKPDKPTNVKPGETPDGWSKSEPACDITMTLYTVDVTVFSDGTTYVSDVSKSTSYEAAKEAYNKANNAQGTADSAYSKAGEAMDSANNAAKVADNYVSSDKLGIMVSENSGIAKETPSTATKHNVLITEEDIQIRDGQTVLASYGKKTILGDPNSNNVELASDGITLRDGGFTSATIKAEKFEDLSVEATESFDGVKVNKTIASGKTWINTYTLDGQVGSLTSVHLSGPSAEEGLWIPQAMGGGGYFCIRRGNNVTITIEANTEATAIDWSVYTNVVFDYKKWQQTTGVITSDLINSTNSYSDEVKATDRVLIGAGYSLVGINNQKMRLAIGNGGGFEKSNAAVILENGDLRLAGDVYVGCKFDSTGGIPLGRGVSGTGTLTLTTGVVTVKPKWWRCGSIVQLELKVACAGSVASGKNIAVGDITGIPKPVGNEGLRSVSYYGNNANISLLATNGHLIVRNAGNDTLSKGNDAACVVTYITNGTML